MKIKKNGAISMTQSPMRDTPGDTPDNFFPKLRKKYGLHLDLGVG